jgi:hypothetical protein
MQTSQQEEKNAVSPKKKFLIIWNITAGGGYTQPFTNLDVLLEEVREGEIGEKWSLEIVEMTQEDYDLLPEFNGY